MGDYEAQSCKHCLIPVWIASLYLSCPNSENRTDKKKRGLQPFCLVFVYLVLIQRIGQTKKVSYLELSIRVFVCAHMVIGGYLGSQLAPWVVQSRVAAAESPTTAQNLLLSHG